MTYPLEKLERPLFNGPALVDASSAANQFAGRTTLSSGSATVTVSTNQVNSDSLVGYGLQSHNVSSGALCVRTISPGNFFTVGWTDGTARAFDATVMWEVRKTS